MFEAIMDIGKQDLHCTCTCRSTALAHHVFATFLCNTTAWLYMHAYMYMYFPESKLVNVAIATEECKHMHMYNVHVYTCTASPCVDL